MNRTVLFVAGVAGVVALAAARSWLRMPPPEPVHRPGMAIREVARWEPDTVARSSTGRWLP